MSTGEFLKIKTCVLKVNIHCDGCKDKVKKILQKIDGVYTLKIDSEQGKVTVSGVFDPAMVIKKLNKNGKYAELWGAPKANNNNNLNNQFKNLQIDHGKGGNNKGQGQIQQKGGGPQGQNPHLQQLQQLKASQDMKMHQQFMKMPLNNGKDQNPKTVKFTLPEDDGLSDDDFDDSDYDDDDYDDDEFDDDDLDVVPLNKMKPMMNNGYGDGSQMANMINNMMNMKGGANGGNNGGNAKKGGGGGGNIPVQMNLGGANGGKKGGNGNNNENQGGGKGGKNGGGGGAAIGNNFNANGAKKGGGMNEGGPPPHGMPNMMTMNGSGSVGHMNNMPMGGNMGNPPMGQMYNLPSVQGLLASGGGGGPENMSGNPYYQQQLAAMMMNQQRADGNERFQPMMYARPPPSVNYIPAPYPPYTYPPPPGERVDQYAMFSDENTSSCSLM